MDQLPHHPGHGKPDHIQVAGEAGHQVAGAGFGEEVLVLLLHILIQVPAELEDQLLGTALIGHNGQVLKAGAEQRKPNEHRNQNRQMVHHLLGDHTAVGKRLEHRVHNAGGDY